MVPWAVTRNYGTLLYWKCSVCHDGTKTEPIPATGHSFGAWKQTKAPTALKKGTKTRICSNCKAVEKQDIKKLKAKIKLNVKSIPLQVKKSTTAVKVTSKAKGDSIKSWKSNKPKIASVTSKGKITGKKVGTAKIKVTLKSNVSATVTVKVQNPWGYHRVFHLFPMLWMLMPRQLAMVPLENRKD